VRGKATWHLHGVRAQLRARFPRTLPPSALIESVFSVVKRKLSARAPGRLRLTQRLQALLLGLAYDIYRLNRVRPPPHRRDSIQDVDKARTSQRMKRRMTILRLPLAQVRARGPHRSSPGLMTARSVAIIASVAPHVTVISRSGSTVSPVPLLILTRYGGARVIFTRL
jgi:hypothetical protein